MKESSRQLLEKADSSIHAAQALLESNYPGFAAGRAYYAMFYVAEAMLNEKELTFRKHGGVHSAFGEHYIKTGLLDARYHRWLLMAFNRRIVADYGIEVDFTQHEVEEMIQQARDFLQEAKRYLGGQLT
jgi:uncharacterized protein (UPF0332 family)